MEESSSMEPWGVKGAMDPEGIVVSVVLTLSGFSGPSGSVDDY